MTDPGLIHDHKSPEESVAIPQKWQHFPLTYCVEFISDQDEGALGPSEPNRGLSSRLSLLKSKVLFFIMP